MKKLRKFVLSCSGVVSLTIELAILAVALVKLFFFSIDQYQANKDLMEVAKRNAFAIEGVRKYLVNKNSVFLGDVERHLELSQSVILKYTGENQAECITASGAKAHIVIDQNSPLNKMINQEYAMNVPDFMGQPCINKLNTGDLGEMKQKELASEILEYFTLALLGIFLFWIKIEERLFEKRFPVRRKNEKDIPYHLN